MPRKKNSPKKTGATRNPPTGRSNWSWGLISLSAGCFIAFLVYLDKIPVAGKEQASPSNQTESKTNKQNKIKTEKKQIEKEPEQRKKARQQFEFYDVLPERGVKLQTNSPPNIVPLRENKAKPQPVKTPVKAQSSPNKISQRSSNEKKSGGLFLYQLQVGAFKDLSKADTMKAQLALLGIESNIQMIDSQGQKIYKVRVGPSTNEQQIRRIQQQLKKNNISSFIQKLKA